ncbi:MAG: adenylate/guanylate cyclase domain-containing protein [Patulibacter sp.]|nr:adenylate/guanylate cyclase domain-containing protein [Patulibacter sp.]
MLRRPLHELYARLGRRYTSVAVLLVLVQAHVVTLAAILVLARFLTLDVGQWALIIGASQLFTGAETLIVARTAYRLLGPVRIWHDAPDGDGAMGRATDAWRALTRLPLRLVAAGSTIRALVWSMATIAVISLTADLPLWPSGVALALAASVVLAAGVLIRYLEVELVLRPVIEAVAPSLSDDVPLDASLSLRWRLLVSVPLVTLVSGGVVASFSTDAAKLGDFGFGMAVALVTSATVALGLSALLVRSVLAPILELQATTEAVMRGQLQRRAAVLAGDEVGRLARSINIGLQGLQERDRLHEALGTYVDPDVADRVLDEGTQLEGQVRDVTIAFIDIRGFTAFAEQSSASEVFALLNEFYGVIVPVIERYGGHANAFQGDGLLAVFGAPSDLEHHADAALTAAIEIAREVRQHFGQDLQLGIGINSGPVVIGTLGGGSRATFTVIGDAVNTASRVEAITRQTGDVILFTEETRRRLQRDHGTISGRPSAPVRGKRTPVRLHSPLLGGRVEEPLSELERGLGELIDREPVDPPTGDPL